MAKKRSIYKTNKQKEIELKKRKKRKIVLIIIILLLLIILGCAYLFTSEEFNIKNITITGNEYLTQEEIYNLSNIKLNDNIFLTLGLVAKVRLKQNPYIEDAKIIKIYPNKIKIEIKERTKEFQILTDLGTYIYIDQQGNILDSSTEKLNYITITGFEITDERAKQVTRLEENDLEKMENILHILDEAKKIEIKDKITQISTKEEYVLYLEAQNIIINLGNVTSTTIHEKMLYVQAILAKEEGKTGTVFVNGNLNEGFKPYFSAN